MIKEAEGFAVLNNGVYELEIVVRDGVLSDSVGDCFPNGYFVEKISGNRGILSAQNSIAVEFRCEYPLEPCTVVDVVDGDTFLIKDPEYSDDFVYVRLIGVDTPEKTHKYYQAAKDLSASLLENYDVFLQREIANKDIYGRLLRHVFIAKKGEKLHLNGYLVACGLARKYFFEPNMKYRREFQILETRAFRGFKGFWEMFYPQINKFAAAFICPFPVGAQKCQIPRQKINHR